MFNWVDSYPAWSAAVFVVVLAAGVGDLHLVRWFSQGPCSDRASKKMRAYMAQRDVERRDPHADNNFAEFTAAPEPIEQPTRRAHNPRTPAAAGREPPSSRRSGPNTSSISLSDQDRSGVTASMIPF